VNPKIFVSAYPFGDPDQKPLELLKATNWEFALNPYARTLTPSEVAELAYDCDGLIAGTEKLDKLIRTNHRLRVVSRVGIGLDSVPLHECRGKGITVTYTPDAVTLAVAEMTVGMMVCLLRNIAAADRNMRRNVWERPFGKRIGKSIIGIVGFGRIGTNVAKLLVPLRPRLVLVNDTKDKSVEIKKLRDLGLDIRHAVKEEIYASADLITLHVPLWSQTLNLINAKALECFRKDAYLMNLSRGGIVNETDLFTSLKSKRIAGAALDCFEKEPYSGPLTELENVILTQHLGSCSFDCHARMEVEATLDLIRYFKGEHLQNEVPEEELSYQSSTG